MLEMVKPDSVGVYEPMLEKIKANFQKEVAIGARHGAVVMAARGGKVFFSEAFGFADPEHTRPLTQDNIFFLMSVSKSLTATAVLKAIDEGKFRLDTKVADLYPAFGAMGKQKITVFDLLTHQVNLWPYLTPIPGIKSLFDPLEEVSDAACKLGQHNVTGASVHYQPYVTWTVLGRLLMLTDDKKRTFKQIMEEDIFAPLGMKDTTIGCTPDNPRRVKVRNCQGNKEIEFIPGLDSAPDTVELPGVNVFSTAPDVLKFVEMLCHKGRLGETRLLSPALVNYAMQNFTGDKINNTFVAACEAAQIPQNHANSNLFGGSCRGEGHFRSNIGYLASPKACYGMGGGTTGYMVDTERELSVVLLGSGQTMLHAASFAKLNDMMISALD